LQIICFVEDRKIVAQILERVKLQVES